MVRPKKVSEDVPTEEFEDYLNSLEKPLAEKSAKMYMNQYKLIRDKVKKDLTDMSVSDIEKYLDGVPNMNTRKNHLNIFIMLKRAKNGITNEELLDKELIKEKYPEYAKLYDLRTSLKQSIETALKEKNVDLCETLPEYKELTDFAKKQTGRAYLVNYILLNYGVRAQDLDTTITNQEINDKEHNFLILDTDKKSVDYIRNRYKTIGSHGAQLQTITDKKFVATVKDLLRDHNSVKMFDLKQADKALRQFTYKGLSESEYFKILVCYLYETKQMTKLFKMGKTRGTNIDIILKNYNINYKPEIKDDDDD